MDEVVSVYSTSTILVTTDKDVENMTQDEMKELLNNGDCDIEYVSEDFDWTTEEHEDWIGHEGLVTVLDKKEVEQ